MPSIGGAAFYIQCRMGFTPQQIRQFLANCQGATVTPRKARGTGEVSTKKTILATFAYVLKTEGVPLPEPEYRFHPERKWRFDYAWPVHKVALEVEGGIWTNGRHTRGKGYKGDMDKYSTAATLGWRILRVEPNELVGLRTAKMIKESIKA